MSASGGETKKHPQGVQRGPPRKGTEGRATNRPNCNNRYILLKKNSHCQKNSIENHLNCVCIRRGSKNHPQGVQRGPPLEGTGGRATNASFLVN